MHLYSKFKEYVLSEFAKVKPLTGRERVWYIWEYHKFRIAVGIFVIALLVSILCNVFSSAKIYLNNASINLANVMADDCVSLTTDAQMAMGLEKREEITLSSFYLTDDPMERTMGLQSLWVRIAANDLDLMFMPESDFYDLETLDIYANVEEILPLELWKAVEPHAIYVTDSASGEEYPAALDITDVPAIKSCGFTAESVVVCVSPTSRNLENCSAMIAYLFELD